MLLAAAWQPGQSPAVLGRLAGRYGGGLLIGLLMVLAAMVLFFPEQFLQCFSEDGTETCELARSLRHHFLPYWELETWDPIPGGRMGTVVVNPSLINSYWTCALQCLLGGHFDDAGELATRLSYWVWWMAIFAVSYRLVVWEATPSAIDRASRIPSPTESPPTAPDVGASLTAIPLGLTMLLVGMLFTFYVGYNPYMADLANPGVPDALFTLLMLLSFDCLRHKDRPGWVISVTLASLVLYAGAVLLVLTLAAAWWWQPIERKETLRWAACGFATLLAVILFYLGFGWLDGSLPYWIDTIDIEYVSDYLSDVPLWTSGPLFFGYFLLGCGGVAAIGLARAFRRDAWQRTVATVTLLYLLVVLGSGFKNLHYLGPLLPVPIVLFLAGCDDRRQRRLSHRSLPVVCSVIVCLAVCWPKARATFTLNRELGRRTTIATDDYLTAVRWARLRYTLREQGVMSWDCDQHTWVVYAQRDARLTDPRSLLLAPSGTSVPGYRPQARRRLAATDLDVTLYARDDDWVRWLSTAQPLRPLDRYPAVFRPLAGGLYSPHNNPLEDVQRLHRPW